MLSSHRLWPSWRSALVVVIGPPKVDPSLARSRLIEPPIDPWGSVSGTLTGFARTRYLRAHDHRSRSRRPRGACRGPRRVRALPRRPGAARHGRVLWAYGFDPADSANTIVVVGK